MSKLPSPPNLKSMAKSTAKSLEKDQASLKSLLHRDAKVLSTDYEGDDILVSAVVPAAISGRLESFAAASA